MSTTRVCLLICAAALLAVGTVSHSIERHAMQIAPLLVVAALIAKRDWVSLAAAALFAFWLLVVTLIWLYLLGIAQVITGDFSPIEIALTVLIGIACAVGLTLLPAALRKARLWIGLPVFAMTFAAQFAVLWASYELPGLQF